MKRYILLLLFVCTSAAFAQKTSSNRDLLFRLDEEKAKLNEFIRAIQRDSGIFQRIIQKIDVDITDTYSKYHKYTPYLELNYMHAKFYDFDTPRLDSNGTPISIGKVFMSERYIESDYYDTFKKPDDYKNDQDGFYYYCKIYFDPKNLEKRLIVYPRYLANICDKNMHLNNKFCLKRDLPTHDNTIRALIAIPDTDYGDFLSENSYVNAQDRKARASAELRRFAKANDTMRVNVHPLFDPAKGTTTIKGPNGFLLHQIRKNTLNVFVNYGKYMKIFRINPMDSTGKFEGTTLTLIHSKTPNNEDFTDNLAYDFTFHSYSNKPLADTISPFVEYTQNLANRRLEYSELPDDEFITGKKRVFSQISFTANELLGINDCRNDPGGFEECLNTLIGKKNLEIPPLQAAIVSDSTELAKILKKVKKIRVDADTLLQQEISAIDTTLSKLPVFSIPGSSLIQADIISLNTR